MHAVGRPNPTRSHVAAMEDMEKAAPGSSLRTGSIDRMVGLTGAAGPFAATVVGTTAAPSSYVGPHSEITMASVEGFQLSGENGSGGLDHGHGNVSLLLGGGVVGGKVHGAWPGLGASSLVKG